MVVVAVLLVAGVSISLALLSVADVRDGVVLDPERLRRDETMAWVARGLLFLGGAWMVIGMIAARTSLVRRPGAAAARASWLSSTRPWRARESMLGLLELDRALLVVVPAGLLVATVATLTAFLVPWPVVLVLGAYALFGLVCVLMVVPRSAWPVVAAIGGVVVPQCLVLLAGVAVVGPLRFWVALWSTPELRVLVFTVMLALMVWMAVAAGGAMNQQVGAKRATGIVLTASGLAITAPSVATALLGPARTGASWKDQLVALNLPEWFVAVPLVVGSALILAGVVVAGRAPRD